MDSDTLLQGITGARVQDAHFLYRSVPSVALLALLKPERPPPAQLFARLSPSLVPAITRNALHFSKGKKWKKTIHSFSLTHCT